MAKAGSETQLYRLIQMFAKCKGDEFLKKADIFSALYIKESSVAVYIHILKKKHHAIIENVLNEDHLVVGYGLKNLGEVTVPQFKRTVPPDNITVRAVSPRSRPRPLTPAKADPPSHKNDNDGCIVDLGEIPILDREVEHVNSNRVMADVVQSLGFGSGASRYIDY